MNRLRLPETRVHLVGIGGSGMSSLAKVLKDAGYSVTGSDINASATIEKLRAMGIAITVGHEPASLVPGTLVVRASCVPDSDPEIDRARQLGLRVLNHEACLGLLSATARTLAVAGTHGKTTTTAMLASILIEAGVDPTVLVGGVVPGLDSGGRLGAGDFLVVEADEFERRFLHLEPEIAVVTSVEADHLDFFSGGLPEIEAAFRSFVARVPVDGWVIVCADSPSAARLAEGRPENTVTYGLGEHADWRAVGISRNGIGGNDFYVLAHDTLVGRFRLRVPGIHNVSDALAAAVAAGRVGVDFTTAATALERFVSVKRRLERIGEVRGAIVVDDYAHNPTKVRASLAALREQHEGRIICLFQPHTYHRLQSLFDSFASAFTDADLVIVTDVYEPAGRGPGSGERSAADLARAIVGTEARYAGDLRSAIQITADELRGGDLLVTMGAGDVTTAGPAIITLRAGRGT